MSVRRDRNGKWRYRKVVKLRDGSRVRVSGTPTLNTRLAAEQEERAHIDRTLNPRTVVERKEVTFTEWFWGSDPDAAEPAGRFWVEWVVGEAANKPSEREAKQYIFRNHLAPRVGSHHIDEIDAKCVARLKAALLGEEFAKKSINNILAVLSKALRWAEETNVIEAAPRIRFYRLDRPEIEFYEFTEYSRLVAAAAKMDPRWQAAVLLAGEAGLRVGEVKAIRWREDIDMVARTVTVNRQVLRHVYGTPKGRTRRTIPMTEALYRALKAIPTVREGLLLLTHDGEPFTDSLARSELNRTCRLAGLPEGSWHPLRHTFATHAAMFGVNPWELNSWLGHKSMEETMRYVHVAEHHRREIPPEVLHASEGVADNTRRTLAMLGARANVNWRGNGVATEAGGGGGAEEIQGVG